MGVDEIHRNLARRLDRFLDGTFGDLVEHHTIDILALQHRTFAQQLDQMPRDSLAFAVEVSREIEHIGLLHGPGNRLDVLGVTLNDLVLHLEIVFGVDRSFLRQQIAHVTV